MLGTIFPHIPDKEQAWLDLHRLTLDKENYVRKNAVLALGFAFLHLSDKKQAWKDLHRLTEDLDEYVRYSAAIALGSTFTHLFDKEQAWKDLIRLILDKTSYVQRAAIITLGIVFPQVPDKKKAWDILHLMTSYVQYDSAVAIGLAFPCIPNKKQAWTDLIWLAQDKDKDIRGSANYSLGRATIFKATEAENEKGFREELEKALGFFEKSLKETIYHNPARFCLPFYRSFYTITFQKQDAAIEVQKYLAEAKNALEGSESGEKLLEVVVNLKNALNEAQKTNNFNNMKYDLNAYRRYCERAADLLSITEEKAPEATKLIRKGLPIINERIKELITEAIENSNILCYSTRGTEAEKYANPICKEIKEFTKIRNPIELEKRITGLIPNLNFLAENLPESERNFVNNKVGNIRKEIYLEDVFVHLNEIIVLVTPHIKVSKNIEALENKLDDIMISLKPGIHEELTITVGAEFLGTGAQHVITIPLQEISYADLKKDLESLKGKSILKLDTLPLKLSQKIKDYLTRNKKNDLLK